MMYVPRPKLSTQPAYTKEADTKPGETKPDDNDTKGARIEWRGVGGTEGVGGGTQDISAA